MDDLEYAVDKIRGDPFETFATSYLRVREYTVIESGSNGPDGGWDARVEVGDQTGIAHASVRKDWKRKIREDAQSVKQLEEESGEEYDLFIFVTNQEVNGSTYIQIKNELGEEYGWDIEILHKPVIIGDLQTTHKDLARQFFDVDLEADRDREREITELVSQRLDKIQEREGVASDLEEGPAVALHVVPVVERLPSETADISSIPRLRPLSQPATGRHTTRGKDAVNYHRAGRDGIDAYAVVQNTGFYESVTTADFYEAKDKLHISCDARRYSFGFEGGIVAGVQNAKNCLEELGFRGTALVYISLIDAKGATYNFDGRGIRFGTPSGIPVDQYTSDPVAISIVNSNCKESLEKPLKQIYRELGHPDGPLHIEDGKWTGSVHKVNGEEFPK